MIVSHDVLVKRATCGYRFLASDEGKRLRFDVNLLNPDTIDLSSACDCALGVSPTCGSANMASRPDQATIGSSATPSSPTPGARSSNGNATWRRNNGQDH
jgi:hypothetical protein